MCSLSAAAHTHHNWALDGGYIGADDRQAVMRRRPHLWGPLLLPSVPKLLGRQVPLRPPPSGPVGFCGSTLKQFLISMTLVWSDLGSLLGMWGGGPT